VKKVCFIKFILFFFLKEKLLIIVVDRCSSLNDICGKHGRCINTDDGQFRCECHFLFGGNRCRSGKINKINFFVLFYF
jgi:hypothetical protein